jgi:GAF domain-containing protein
MSAPVTILRPVKVTRLVSVAEMGLKLAGARDTDLLLKRVSHFAREIMTAQFSYVNILDARRRTISGRVCFSGMAAADVLPAISVLRPGFLSNMLTAGSALRLRDVTFESLGLDLRSGNHHLSSVLSVPLCGSLRVQGLLLLANKLDADEFSDQDEQLAVALASQTTLAFERMEQQTRTDEELGQPREALEAYV